MTTGARATETRTAFTLGLVCRRDGSAGNPPVVPHQGELSPRELLPRESFQSLDKSPKSDLALLTKQLRCSTRGCQNSFTFLPRTPKSPPKPPDLINYILATLESI